MAQAKKDTSDPIIFAHTVLDQIIAKHDPEVAREQGKNPHAVALGKRGGSKGGHDRVKNTTAKQRQRIAENAASVRWGGRKKSVKPRKIS